MVSSCSWNVVVDVDIADELNAEAESMSSSSSASSSECGLERLSLSSSPPIDSLCRLLLVDDDRCMGLMDVQLWKDALMSSEVKTPLCDVDADSSTFDDAIADAVDMACGVEKTGAVADRIDAMVERSVAGGALMNLSSKASYTVPLSAVRRSSLVDDAAAAAATATVASSSAGSSSSS